MQNFTFVSPIVFINLSAHVSPPDAGIAIGRLQGHAHFNALLMSEAHSDTSVFQASHSLPHLFIKCSLNSLIFHCTGVPDRRFHRLAPRSYSVVTHLGGANPLHSLLQITSKSMGVSFHPGAKLSKRLQFCVKKEVSGGARL